MTDPLADLNLSLDDVERVYDLRRPPNEVTADIVALLTETNALVSLEPAKAIFMSGGRLTRVATEIINGHTYYRIKNLETAGLKGRLAELARWQKTETRFGTPDSEIIADILERADELCVDMPVLEQVITYPIFAANGVLHMQPGYSRDTRCWYSPAAGVEIPAVPEVPTDDDIAEAKRLILDELVVDFPFVNQASRANALTIMLEPFARRLITGPTPIHSIDAPKEGTGKSLLADLMLLPAVGPHAKSSTQSMSEEEWKKQLTTMMLGGEPYWYCDNLRTTLDSGHLASTITKAVYEERILGGNSSCVRPVQHTWVITGNNISYSGEMARRVAPTYLNAHLETPQIGRTFKHADVKGWASAHRGELIWAALVLIQRWIAKGKPRKRVSKVLGMFEAWSEIMGNILELAGVDGFLGNLTDFYDEAIQEEHDSAPFVIGWFGAFGEAEITAVQLVDLAQKHLDLTKTVPGFGAPKPTARQVASFIKKINKRVYSGLEVVRIVKKGKADRYRVVRQAGSSVALELTVDTSEFVTDTSATEVNASATEIKIDSGSIHGKSGDVGQNGQNWL